MANAKNLKPQAHKLTVEEASRGGKKSAKTRAERKTFREGLLLLLNEPLTKDGKKTDKTTQDAIIAALVKKAAAGDTRAFEMIRDTIGEKPAQDVNVSAGNFSALDDAFAGLKGDAK